MTIAEKIAEQFCNDGQRWTDPQGNELDDVCLEHGRCEDADEACIARYVFPDDSVLTIHHDAWDLGYRGCYCWQSVGHQKQYCAKLKHISWARDPRTAGQIVETEYGYSDHDDFLYRRRTDSSDGEVIVERAEVDPEHLPEEIALYRELPPHGEWEEVE